MTPKENKLYSLGYQKGLNARFNQKPPVREVSGLARNQELTADRTTVRAFAVPTRTIAAIACLDVVALRAPGLVVVDLGADFYRVPGRCLHWLRETWLTAFSPLYHAS